MCGFMGTITVAVEDSVETQFRKAVKDRLGIGKGKIGKAVTEAMKQWVYAVEQQDLRERALKRLEKGYNMGKILYKHRDELHER